MDFMKAFMDQRDMIAHDGRNSSLRKYCDDGYAYTMAGTIC